MDGEVDREMTVERDSNHHTRASHTMTISNNNNHNININYNNNNDTIITILITMVTLMICQR